MPAPFLGGAFNLFQSTALGIAIFTMISIGLALPMSVIILNPNLRRFLPKSGQWNQRIKFSLTIGFTITIAWLAWVLYSQVSTLTFTSIIMIITIFFILLILKNRHQQTKLLIIGGLTLLGFGLPIISANNTTHWQPYSPSLTQSLETTKRPYFIDVTAKWCITCQTNKLTVLNTSFGKKLFTERNIALIQADWTNKNEEITELLAEYKKVSIPVYIYFDGNKHSVIGDILTKEKLQNFINKTNSL